MRRLILAILIVLLAAAGVSAQTTDDFSAELETQNEFPRALVFQATASSDQELADARLFFRPAGSSFWSSQPVEVTPGTTVTVEYEWFTGNQVLPPNLLLDYRWRFRTSDGESFETELQQVEFTDTRFEWQRLDSDRLSLLWYDGDRAWGEQMFATAQEAMDEIEADLGVTLDQPVRIVVYGNKDDFQGAFPPQQSWIGGQAFPDMHITVQIIAAGQDGWMSQVIPHEISHLVFHQATQEALANPPQWFDEGLAQYHEPGEFGEEERNTLRDAAQNGDLLPLSRLQGNFGADHNAVSLAYTQSWAMVDYLVRDCGRDELHTLIEGLNDDLSMDEALETACDYDEQTFYNRWLEQELGVTPPEEAPGATAPAETDSAAEPGEPQTDPPTTSSRDEPLGGIPVRLVLGVVAVGAAFVALIAGGLAVLLVVMKRA